MRGGCSWARRASAPLGLMEADPLLIQAEQKLIGQADELVVLVDSSKFARRSSLILCPLSRIHTVITDEGIADREARMLESSDIRLIVAARGGGGQERGRAEPVRARRTATRPGRTTP